MQKTHQAILEYIAVLSKKQHLPHNYEVVISTDESIIAFKGALVDIRLEAGNPPKMIIPMLFISRCFLLEKKLVNVFRGRIIAALEKYPRMLRTLDHNIPIDRALILQSSMKQWIRTRGLTDTNTVEFRDDEFEIEYIAIVKDKITGHSFSQAGPHPYKAKDEAKSRLTKIFMNNQSLMDFRDTVLGMQDNVPTIEAESAPNVVELTTQIIEKEEGLTEQTNERYEY